MLYGLKSLHVCVDMLNQVDKYLATGIRQSLKMTKASVTIVVVG